MDSGASVPIKTCPPNMGSSIYKQPTMMLKKMKLDFDQFIKDNETSRDNKCYQTGIFKNLYEYVFEYSFEKKLSWKAKRFQAQFNF
jgi:hypothetical protein